MNASLAYDDPQDDPASPEFIDVEIRMPPAPPRLPVNILQSAAQRRADASRDRLLATLRLVNRTDAEALAAAAARLAAGRRAGIHPTRGYVTAAMLARSPGRAMDRARWGEHVTVTTGGAHAAVMVAAADYADLLDAREQLAWARGTCPSNAEG